MSRLNFLAQPVVWIRMAVPVGASALVNVSAASGVGIRRGRELKEEKHKKIFLLFCVCQEDIKEAYQSL